MPCHAIHKFTVHPCSDLSCVLPRIIITAEEAQDELKDLCYIIKVTILRLTPPDSS